MPHALWCISLAGKAISKKHMEELSKRYNPGDIEDKWYKHWMESGHFHSTPDDREAFSIVIPPPNVTGQLHMGHILNNTIQDTLIRRARQESKNLTLPVMNS
jgi:valyl-tRNA synthetase